MTRFKLLNYRLKIQRCNFTTEKIALVLFSKMVQYPGEKLKRIRCFNKVKHYLSKVEHYHRHQTKPIWFQ